MCAASRTTRRLALMIFLGCSTLYYLTRSPALDEWDSVQFALGVGEFNLWKHQPHPPGYPLYVAFGWLGERWLGLDVHDALSLGSALGGGMLVAGWFVLIARRFALPVAVMSTVALAGSVVVWMSATKVLTDPLGAGLLTLALVWLDEVSPMGDASRRVWWLAAGSVTAAAAVGVRPQNFGVLLLIVGLVTAREIRRGGASCWRCWFAGPGMYVAGCLAWLAPVMALQARTPGSGGRWWTYGSQLLGQWRWRLDQPKVFLGAAGQGSGMLLYRIDHHLLGWFKRGFGFALDTVGGWCGLLVIVTGWAMYGWAVFLKRSGQADSVDAAGVHSGRKAFWRMHLPWAAVYGLMVFCCLPGDQRYYLPIFPLLILAAVGGWWTCWRGHWRWIATVVPVAVVVASVPLVGPNHVVEPPPVRLLRWLQERYPPGERAEVWLILRDSRRHADWYAPDFHLVPADGLKLSELPDGLAQARDVYTDDPLLAQGTALSGTWRLVGRFQRSPLIYRKHNDERLYRRESVSGEVK